MWPQNVVTAKQITLSKDDAKKHTHLQIMEKNICIFSKRNKLYKKVVDMLSKLRVSELLFEEMMKKGEIMLYSRRVHISNIKYVHTC